MSRGTNPNSDLSVVYWCTSTSKHKCGYCKNEEGSISHGMWAKTLSTKDYQNLIDRGWRRSGHYCYKPIMDEICCPQYTIKCDVLNFHLSKSQKRVIKKFNKFINDDELKKIEIRNQYDEDHDISVDNASEAFIPREKPPESFDQSIDLDTISNKTSLNCDPNASNSKKENVCSSSVDVVDGISCNESKQENQRDIIKDKTEDIDGANAKSSTSKSSDVKTKLPPKSGVGPDPNRPKQKKARLLRLERKQEKMMKRGMSLEKLPQTNEGKTLEEFLSEPLPNAKHKFKITLERINEHHKYFDMVAELFAKYQIAIHNETSDECDKEQFIDFLIDTPLQYKPFPGNSKMGFGSFHQLYWIDNKLIAVGVIDILPKCVSAVYFFYDPDYGNLTLGTYGSMREVQFARRLHQIMPSIENYYMGFYIHSCPKMRYKGHLNPSYLLCPETYKWISMELCTPKLDVEKYCRLIDNLDAIDENACNKNDVDSIKVFTGRIVSFQKYKDKYGSDEQKMYELIGSMIGKKSLDTLVFIPN